MTSFAARLCSLAALSCTALAQHGRDQVCLLQTGFMHRQGQDVLRGPEKTTIGNYHEHVSGTNFQDAIAALSNYNTHVGGRPEPCCGSLGDLVEEADAASCTKVGVNDLQGMVHSRAADEQFGDNVGVDKYEYFLEDCRHAADPPNDCMYTEITDPDVQGHIFKVGVSNIKIRATDLQNNQYECMRTVNVLDKQPPYFVDPDFLPMHPDNLPDDLHIAVPEDACVVTNEAGYERHHKDGFLSEAADNCDIPGMTHFGLRASDPGGVHLRKLIYTYDSATGFDAGELLYDSDVDSPNSNSANLVPGTYHMKYMLIDDFSEPFHFSASEDLPEWHQFNHSVVLTVLDETPPTSIADCPADINITIEPTEMSAVVNWTVPHVDGDNCLGTGDAPPPPTEVEGKHPGMTMEVGAHIVKYEFHDAHGNPYGEECIFQVKISHRNHPVTVTCPELEKFDTLLNSDFSIVDWPLPVAVQNGQTLDASHIAYEPDVASGFPFPFGETTIKVIATGQEYAAVQSGHQELETDECFFKVTVGDPQDPKCDGREYRCLEEGTGIKPYGLCDGPEIAVTLHDEFAATGEFEAASVSQLVNEACCTSQTEVSHTCTAIAGTGSKQCMPSTA